MSNKLDFIDVFKDKKVKNDIITVRVDTELKESFTALCKENNIPVATALYNFMYESVQRYKSKN